MKKKILALLLAILAVVPLLVACGTSYYQYDTYKDFIKLGNPAEISVMEADIENGILRKYYDYFQDEITAKTLTPAEVTSGEVKYGDTVQIDYTGYKVGETTPFSGGTATDYKLEIGSGTFIEGFESGLIGHVVGEKVRIYLTFPKNYSSADLADKRVYFDVTIDKITQRYNYPEMTDAKIKEQSGGEFETVDAFKKDARETVTKNLIWAKYYDSCSVQDWPDLEFDDYYYNALNQHKQTAAMYSMTLDSYAAAMGYTNADNLRVQVAQQARQQCKQDVMVLAYVEANNLLLDDAALETKMREKFDDAVAQGYEGDFDDYVDDVDESALRIAVYTDIMMDHMLPKAKTVNNLGKNGFYTVKENNVSKIYYYINGEKQTGWIELDLEEDGTPELYYLNTDENHLGIAFHNVTVSITAKDSQDKKYHKFGEYGRFLGYANNELIFDGNGYLYIKDDTYVTGKQELDLTGEIEGNETYIFGTNGYRYDSVYFNLSGKNTSGVALLENFGDVDFGKHAGKYYDFGANGIYDPEKNGYAGGKDGAIFGDKYYKDGVLMTDTTYTKDGATYYFQGEKGEMVKNKLITINEHTHYFGDDGKMVKAESADSPVEKTIDEVTYLIDNNGYATVKPAAN